MKKKKRDIIMRFSASPLMVDTLYKVLQMKSKENGRMIRLSEYLRELVIRDIRENYLKQRIAS